MDFLELLLKNFLDDDKNNTLKSVFELLKNHSFDLKSVLSPDGLRTILPIVNELFSFSQNKNPTNNVGQYQNISPIESFTDREIVLSLNRYLSSES